MRDLEAISRVSKLYLPNVVHLLVTTQDVPFFAVEFEKVPTLCIWSTMETRNGD